MSGRKEIKKEHERFHVDNFLAWFNHAYRSDFKVISEPEPPEAIIQSSNSIRWVEVTTAFWNAAYAKDINSYATPGETHVPIKLGPHFNMDQQFAKNFVDVLVKKLEKKSYLKVKSQYGKGYLIIPIYFPYLDSNTIDSMKIEWSNRKINDLDCFKSVRICYPSISKWRLYRWPKQ